MKNYAIAALAALPCMVAVAPAATFEEYAACLDEQLSAVNDLVNILSSAKDKASADAAADQLAVIVAKSQESQAKAEALGEPSEEVKAQLQAHFKTREAEVAATFTKLIPIMTDLQSHDFYGSEKLAGMLQAIGGAEGPEAMPGEDDMDDEEEE